MGWKGANVKRRVDWDGVLISLLWIDSRVMQCNRMISNSSGTDLGGEVMREDFKHFIQFESRKRNHSICYSLKTQSFSLSFLFDWF